MEIKHLYFVGELVTTSLWKSCQISAFANLIRRHLIIHVQAHDNCMFLLCNQQTKKCAL